MDKDILGLTAVTAAASIINAIALIVDVYFRNKVEKVNLVNVPNQNEGGFETFKVSGELGFGALVKSITIKKDGSVVVEGNSGISQQYPRYISFRK